MPDTRIDAYIAKAQPFARPILTEVRRRLHAAVPGLEETIKWNAPFFLLDGRIFASMAGFKAHAKVLLWNPVFKSAMPEARDVTSVAELPAVAVFAKQVKASAAAFRATPATTERPATKKAAKAKRAAPTKKRAAKR
jgi:hypothetical protein